MPSARCNISMSLDGFAAGPNQSLTNPIGEGGMQLHGAVQAPGVGHLTYRAVR